MARVVLFGISGLIGSSLAPLLAREYGEVMAPVRKPYGTNDDTIKTPIVDFDRLGSHHRELFMGADTLFYCLGSTRSRAGSFEEFQKIEWALANAVLGTARTCGVSKVLMISARGADEMSLLGYLRVKGHIERYARELGFPQLVIARPSLLMGERAESRMLEGLSVSLARPLLKPLQKYLPSSAPIQDHELARALVNAARTTRAPLWIVENKDLLRLSKTQLPTP